MLTVRAVLNLLTITDRATELTITVDTAPTNGGVLSSVRLLALLRVSVVAVSTAKRVEPTEMEPIIMVEDREILVMVRNGSVDGSEPTLV